MQILILSHNGSFELRVADDLWCELVDSGTSLVF
jgi:hypothetical protein